MGCLNWRESRAEGRAEQKSSDLIPVQARDWLSRKRTPVRPPVSPVPAKLIFEEGTLEGRLDPHVQFQSPMETRSKIRVFDMVNSPGKLHKFTCVLKVKYLRQKKHADWISRMSAANSLHSSRPYQQNRLPCQTRIQTPVTGASGGAI
jgi:hypothetical protein